MGLLDILLRRDSPASPAITEQPPAPGDRRLDNIENLLSGIGTAGDLGQAGRPVPTLRLSPLERDTLYETNGYAQRIVDFFADETTRKGWKAIDSSDESNALTEEEERLQVFANVQEAMTWARKDGGALIFPILDEDPMPGILPNQILQQPLDLKRVRRIRELQVFEAVEFSAQTWGMSPTEPRYREPVLWSIQAEGAATSLVHWTRVMYLPGVRLSSRRRRQNNGIDDSVLQVCWDAIRDKTTIDQGSASLAQRLSLNVLKVQSLDAKQTAANNLFFKMKMKAIATSMSMLNMIVIDEGDEFDVRSSPIAGFKDLDQAAKERISCVSGIPLTILFGEPPGGLNTDGRSSREAVNNAVYAMQQSVLSEPLRWLYRLMYAQKQGPTRGNIPKSWKIEFNPLEQLSDVQQADLELKHTTADATRIQWGIVSAEHVAKSRYSEKGYANELLPVTEEEIAESEAAAEALALAQAEAAVAAVPKFDARDPEATIFLVRLSGEELKAWDATRKAVAKLLPDLETVSDPPHVTVLFCGGVPLEDVAGLGACARGALEGYGPASTDRSSVGFFGSSESSDGKTPIIIEFSSREFDALNAALLRSCAHLIEAQQHKTYRPHTTIGYLPRALTGEEMGALASMTPEVSVRAEAVELLVGPTVVHTFPLAGLLHKE